MYLEAELFETVVDRGTKNYENLVNKPKINGVELSGNKSGHELGLVEPGDLSVKTSDLVNDGDGESPFATQEYVEENGGKINSISVNGVAQTIDEDKNVDLNVPDSDTGATSVEVVGNGNAVTEAGYDETTRKMTLTKGVEFQTANDNSLDTSSKSVVGAINEVNTRAKNADIAKGFADYLALINDLNSASSTAYRVGQSFYVQTKEVPDLWVISVESSSVAYLYTTDSAFVSATGAEGGQQVGYYKLAQLEGLKVDLSNYVQKSTTIAGVDLQDNISKSELLQALNVEDGAEANDVYSVNGKTGAVVLDADDIDDSESSNKFVSQVEKNAWNGKQNAINIRRV